MIHPKKANIDEVYWFCSIQTSLGSQLKIEDCKLHHPEKLQDLFTLDSDGRLINDSTARIEIGEKQPREGNL